MKWEDLASLGRSVKEHILDKPRRMNWVANGLLLFFLTHGQDAFLIGRATLGALWDKKPDEWTLGILVGIARDASIPFLWMGLCFFGAFVVGLLLHRYLLAEIAPGSNYVADRQRFLLEGVEHAGLFRVYRADPSIPVKLQPYADTMRAKLGTANNLRILTIAGYEYIGKGQDALLWEGIKKREDLDVEIILLDPDSDGGRSCIASRIQCLSQRDSNFDEGQLREHIAATRKALDKLKGQRAHFEIKLLQEHPLFRILILDEDMWVSAYEATVHGHESKIFHFRKEGTATWFSAFEALYVQASRRAKSIAA